MKNRALLLSCFLLLLLRLPAQQLENTLTRLADRYQPEKIFLHYDKAAYAPGETVWFKAYLLEELLPATGSKTCYVDWVAENGEVLWHSVSPVVDGVTNGHFTIPENFTGSFVQVKAYTKWMLNFDTAFLYSKDIPLLTKPAPKGGARPAPATQVQFFPEGGDLVAGVPNRLAFKATNAFGKPVRIRGLLLDGKGNKIDSLRVQHDGMGSLSFTPAPGTTYSARWRDEKGTEQTFALPLAKENGISLQVTTAGDRKYLTLHSPATAGDPLKKLHVIGTMNSRPAFSVDVEVAPGSLARKVIPTADLPSGILTITVFDALGQPAAERISFINNREYLFRPVFEVEHWGLNKRARNEITLTLPEKMRGANLSVSVTDAGIERDSAGTIVSQLLLTSDLKGYVHNPSYYFSSDKDSVAQQLDLVMLTNGWRRFKWEDLSKGLLPRIQYPKDTTYLSLSGKVFGASKSQLSSSMVLLVKEKDSPTRMMLMPIDAEGNFRDPDVVFFDTLKVWYQLKSKLLANAEARFMTDRLPAPNYLAASKSFLLRGLADTAGFARHNQLAYEAARQLQQARGKMMEGITVKAKAKTPIQAMDEKYSNGLFRGGDAYQFDLVNDPFARGATSIFTFLQGKVPGLQVSIGGMGSTPTLTWRGGAPQLFLDEMPASADIVSTIPVTDVAYIKVLRPPFYGGSGGGNGAIVIYTRKGDDDINRPGYGLASNKIMCYSPIREFYSPNYASFDRSNETPDLRTTLYWNPQVRLTDKNRKMKLTFYNNDVTKSFRVTIVGMSSEGLLSQQEEIME